MRVFVTGAAGVLGRRLIPTLVGRGHHVVGLTRSAEKRGLLEQLGAEALVADVLKPTAILDAVVAAKPEIVVSLLTDLPQRLDLRRINETYDANNRLRVEGTSNLVAAARAASVSRLIIESLAIWYAPDSTTARDEQSPLFLDAPEPIGRSVRALTEMEHLAQQPPFKTVILRYGSFYGPGTWFGRGGSIHEDIANRRYPVLGDGAGYYSWIHIDDAAAATAAAIESDASGVFNVVDDHPVQTREWLPAYAETIGAPPPRSVPLFMARLVAGGLVDWQAQMPPVSNARIKQTLGWRPAYASWRDGFGTGL